MPQLDINIGWGVFNILFNLIWSVFFIIVLLISLLLLLNINLYVVSNFIKYNIKMIKHYIPNKIYIHYIYYYLMVKIQNIILLSLLQFNYLNNKWNIYIE